MFLLLSFLAVLLTFWLHYRCSQKIENQQNKEKVLIKAIKDGLATFGLTFWAALLSVTIYNSNEFPISIDIEGASFKNSLDVLLKVSALFLLFPLIFNLISMVGDLSLRRSWRTVFVNFTYNVMWEFGMFWAIVVLGFYLF